MADHGWRPASPMHKQYLSEGERNGGHVIPSYGSLYFIDAPFSSESKKPLDSEFCIGSCPFTLPEPEELAIHWKEYKTFEATHDLKSDLSSLLDTASDGCVPTEDWEFKKLAQRELFDGMLQAVLSNEDPDDDEPIRNEKDLRAIWPFDL